MNDLKHSPWYRLGRCEGAIKMALIDLKFGRIEKARRILERVLEETESEDASRAAKQEKKSC